jgi:hypothetical protein
MESILIWCGAGIPGFVLLYVQDEVDMDDEFFLFWVIISLLGGPIFTIVFFILFLMDYKVEADRKALKKEKEVKRKVKRKEEAVKTKQRKEEALKEYPILFQKIEKSFILIKADNSKLTKEFFDDVNMIIDYCNILNKNKLTEKEMLRDILIFARLNVLQFYEANNIMNAECLSERINTILRKIK